MVTIQIIFGVIFTLVGLLTIIFNKFLSKYSFVEGTFKTPEKMFGELGGRKFILFLGWFFLISGVIFLILSILGINLSHYP